MKADNPNSWKKQFDIVREANGLVSIWIAPVNSPEGEHIATLHVDYLPSLIAALKRFEQAEGRKT